MSIDSHTYNPQGIPPKPKCERCRQLDDLVREMAAVVYWLSDKSDEDLQRLYRWSRDLVP